MNDTPSSTLSLSVPSQLAPASATPREGPARSALSDTDKFTMYVLVRTDIDPVQQVVQAAHAAAEAGRAFYAARHGIASLIVLGVPNRDTLLAARDTLLQRGLETTLFFEPDFGMGESALATEPLDAALRRRLRDWPLLKAPNCAEDAQRPLR